MSQAIALQEGVPLRRLAAAAAVLGLVQGLGSVVRDCALTCHVGYRHAPIAFLIVAALSLPFVALQIKMQQRWGRRVLAGSLDAADRSVAARISVSAQSATRGVGSGGRQLCAVLCGIFCLGGCCVHAHWCAAVRAAARR
jgi:hypothetical protein